MNEFRCYKDDDVEQFLRKQAIDFVKQEICSVYLFLDSALFDKKIVSVEAYFTLSHKAIGLSSDVSATVRKKVTSLKSVEVASVVLIGQLAKYMSLDREGNTTISAISAKEILDHAIMIIMYAKELIVCRAALVETKFEENLYMIYESYGFKPLQINPTGELKQFYLRVRTNQSL